MNDTLKVSGLLEYVSNNELMYLFGRFGRIKKIENIGPGAVTIQFEDHRNAQSALNELSNMRYGNENMNIEYYQYYQKPKDLDILSNDEIMEEWLNEQIYNDGVLVLSDMRGSLPKIPLSLFDFLNWFKANQPEIIFSFPTLRPIKEKIELSIRDKSIELFYGVRDKNGIQKHSY